MSDFLRTLGATIAALLLAWVINGEVKARMVDDALGIAATECLSEKFGRTASLPDALNASGLMAGASGHEILYMRVRSSLIKRC